jgi:hypothetical protein
MSFTNPISGKVAGTTTITAAECNAIGVNSARAIDGTNGGTYTPTAVIDIGGAAGGLRLTETSGTPSRLQLTSRRVTRMMSGAGYVVPSGAGWAYDSVAPTAGAFKYINTSSGVECLLPIAVPDGATIREIKVYYIGGTGHAAFPGGAPTFPLFGLYHYDITTAALTQVGSNATVTGTASTDNAVYEGATPFAMTLTGLSHVVRRDVRRYFLEFTAEAGANFQSGGTIHGVSVGYDMTYYDEHGTG